MQETMQRLNCVYDFRLFLLRDVYSFLNMKTRVQNVSYFVGMLNNVSTHQMEY